MATGHDEDVHSAPMEGSEEGIPPPPKKNIYDNVSFFRRLFFVWIRYWVENIGKPNFNFENLHPLPKNDQIKEWQPILSKHVSDGILKAEFAKDKDKPGDSATITTKTARFIILRALLLTYGFRIFLILLANIAVNVASVGMSIFLKKLLVLLSAKEKVYLSIVFYAGLIAVLELVVSLLEQHLTFHTSRLESVMEASISITLFQHSMCHRRAYNLGSIGHNTLAKCKGVVHSWPCGNAECGENPLRCPARRYQNKDLSPQMYTFLLLDTYCLMLPVDGMIICVRLFTTFITSIIIIRTKIGVDILTCALILTGTVLMSSLLEVINGFAYMHSIRSKDYRYSKTSNVLGNMDIIKFMGLEDVGYNIVQNSRDDEMAVLFTRSVLYAINSSLTVTIGTIIFLVMIKDYLRDVTSTLDVCRFDASAPMTIMFIISKLTKATENFPNTVKYFMEAIVCLVRVDKFLNTCSPNYYLGTDISKRPQDSPKINTYEQMALSLPSDDTLVLFDKASFAWYNTYEECMRATSDTSPQLKNISFILKRKDICIVTGNQGCGKSSLLKAINGEMSLTEGKMAVAPLSTGMPIFYSSQDIWLPSGSIRSIITFGHIFDEEIYKRVIRCVELEKDFRSWARGDSRVISEQGYSLSGGQRVRVGLARALYAYMIFSKANEQLENRCCFLMCLDEPFHGLDPNVTKLVFNNLFNKRTGLLVRDDVAVILTVSRVISDTVFDGINCRNVVEIPLYRLDTNGFTCVGKVGTAITSEESEVSSANVSPDASSRLCTPKALSTIPNAVLNTNIYNPDRTALTKVPRTGRPVANANNPNEAAPDPSDMRRAYKAYISTVGYILCTAVLVMLIAGITFDKVNSILLANWSDALKPLTDCNLTKDDKLKILEDNAHLLRLIIGFSIAYIITMYGSYMFTSVGNLFGSQKLHIFALKSLFFRSSTELPLKKSVGEVITLLSGDLFFIDDILGKAFLFSIMSLLRLAIHFGTMCSAAPIIIPIPILIFYFIYFKVFRYHLKATNHLQCFMFDALAKINTTYLNIAGGSALFRSYRREGMCMEYLYASSELYIRTRFMKKCVPLWIMVIIKLVTSFTIFVVTVMLISFTAVTGKELQIANLGLIVTLLLELNGLITQCVAKYALCERMLCSMSRYENYLLRGKYSLKEKFDSMDEIVLYNSAKASNAIVEKGKADLLRRRKFEFRNCVKRRYRSVWTTLCYRPRMQFVDVASYLPGDHSTLTLDNVSVTYMGSSGKGPATYILKNLNATATAGDVVGIVGRTGAGKTTLFRSLQNIARNRDGQLLLDGRDLNTIPRGIVRQIVGILPQIPFVFKGWTLRRFLDPRMLYSDDEIISALECCGLLDMVKTLHPTRFLDAVLVDENLKIARGLYVVIPIICLKQVKEEGFTVETKKTKAKVSGKDQSGPCFTSSQLRMLTLSRLFLYRNHYRLLLIDEPPSENCGENDAQEGEHVDVVPDKCIPVYDLVDLYFKHCTTFIVAHDLRALRSCNQIWFMESGEITRKIMGASNVAEYLNNL